MIGSDSDSTQPLTQPDTAQAHQGLEPSRQSVSLAPAAPAWSGSIAPCGHFSAGFTYTALVRITVCSASESTAVVRESSGAGHGIDIDLGQAHESALKEVETDAFRRALMTFANPFGLGLYDRQQREVTSSATPAPNANPSSSSGVWAPAPITSAF
jgi:hypothetical protein